MTHWWDPERLVDYQVFGMRQEIAGFEARWREYVDSADTACPRC